MATTSVILQPQGVFDQYEKARMHFAQTVADLSTRPQNAEHLCRGNVVFLLAPLLSDTVPNIQRLAAIALGRLADHLPEVATLIIQHNMLAKLLTSVEQKSKYYKTSLMFILRSISKHSPELAESLVNTVGLQSVIECLEHFDPSVKEAAAWVIGNIAGHSVDLARTVEKAGTIPILVLCLQEPEICLKQVATAALCDIVKHSVDLAQRAVDALCVSVLLKAASNPNSKLKKTILNTLANLCKYTVELTETVIESETIPVVLMHVGHPNDEIKRAAAMVIKEIVKHNAQLAHLVVNSGGLGPLIEMIGLTKGNIRLPAIVAVGYIAAYSEALALAVIASNAITQLAVVLKDEELENVVAGAVWALGHTGKHTSEHANQLSNAELFPTLVELMVNPKSSEDLKTKCRYTLKHCLQKCTHLPSLETLLHTAPVEILKCILGQLSKILPVDAKARRTFAVSGSLRKIQEIQAEPGSTVLEFITIINCCYPDEMIRYYTPNYPDILLQELDNFSPNIPSIFTQRRKSVDEAQVFPALSDSMDNESI